MPLRSRFARSGRRRPLLGFTLVELMIVVGILGLLSTMATVKYRGALRVARVSKAKRELRVLAAAIDMYMASHSYQLPLTLEDVGFGGRLDPWGYPYMYLNFQMGTGSATQFVLSSGLIDPATVAGWGGTRPSQLLNPDGDPMEPEDVEDVKRKDRFLFPLNSDYDLFSVGLNGQSWSSVASDLSLDDIIRANDGAFYGIASDY